MSHSNWEQARNIEDVQSEADEEEGASPARPGAAPSPNDTTCPACYEVKHRSAGAPSAPPEPSRDALWREAVATVRARYPESVFTPPPEGTAPDCYAAAGARLACDAILGERAALGSGAPVQMQAGDAAIAQAAAQIAEEYADRWAKIQDGGPLTIRDAKVLCGREIALAIRRRLVSGAPAAAPSETEIFVLAEVKKWAGDTRDERELLLVIREAFAALRASPPPGTRVGSEEEV